MGRFAKYQMNRWNYFKGLLFFLALTGVGLPLSYSYEESQSLKSLSIDGCRIDDFKKDLRKVVGLPLNGKQLLIEYQNCGVFYTDLFRSSTQVEQRILMVDELENLLNESLLSQKEIFLRSLQNYRESDVGAWVIRFDQEVIIRPLVLRTPSLQFLPQQPWTGAVMALEATIRQFQSDHKTNREPDQILFIRRKQSLYEPLFPNEREMFSRLNQLYLRPRIAFMSLSFARPDLTFAIDNFSERYRPLLISSLPTDSRRLRADRARDLSLQLLDSAQQRLTKSKEIYEASKRIINPSKVLTYIESARIRLPDLKWAFSEGPEDFMKCWNGNLVAYTRMKTSNLVKRGIMSPKPASELVYFCDYAFAKNYSLDNFAIIVLHESAHQVGVVSESDATFLANIVYTLATGKVATEPGRSKTFDFSQPLKELQRLVNQSH